MFGEQVPENIPEKKKMLGSNHIALWDVIHSCDISGSSDSSISNVVPNDLSPILNKADIQKIIVNGKTAEKFYKRYIEPVTKRSAICMPSTSPANAAWSLDDLIGEWRKCVKENRPH